MHHVEHCSKTFWDDYHIERYDVAIMYFTICNDPVLRCRHLPGYLRKAFIRGLTIRHKNLRSPESRKNCRREAKVLAAMWPTARPRADIILKVFAHLQAANNDLAATLMKFLFETRFSTESTSSERWLCLTIIRHIPLASGLERSKKFPVFPLKLVFL